MTIERTDEDKARFSADMAALADCGLLTAFQPIEEGDTRDPKEGSYREGYNDALEDTNAAGLRAVGEHAIQYLRDEEEDVWLTAEDKANEREMLWLELHAAINNKEERK